MFSRLSEREVGQYPLSIATSLAIESLTNIHPDIQHKRMPLLEYSNIWVNIRTLFRNMLGSVNDNDRAALHPDEIADYIVQEMDQLQSIVAQYKQYMNVVFYISDYMGLETHYPSATIRMDTTEKQKNYTLLQASTLDWLIKNEERYGITIRLFPLKLRPEQNDTGKTIILTHYAFDLLSRKSFDDLSLLESHTGAIKTHTSWYTKYSNGRELSMIPFREDFIQVFGDSETFRPMDIKLRRELIEVAEKYKWTPRTTRDMISYGINQMKNPYAKEILKKILV